MTAPVTALARSLQLLRAELQAARNRSAQGKGSSPINIGAVQPEAIAGRRSAISRLPGKLRTLRSADGQVPQAKLLRAFVEAALLDEFGEEQQLDPAFGALVERTCQALEADPGNASLLQEAATELLDVLDT